MRYAAFDLSLDQGGVDRTPDVVCRNNLTNPYRAEVEVDGDEGHLGRERVGGVRGALSVGIERRRRRVERAPALRDHLLAGDHRQGFQVQRTHDRPVIEPRRCPIEADLGVRPNVCELS